ncbi:peptidoglycan-binding protein [Deinococcus altitudinis]|uniref:peptidoglycan-binding domain-containing protein n=1 Tax=Deinococcus altitudinis TaxID=468914 RepID=UPI003892BA6B
MKKPMLVFLALALTTASALPEPKTPVSIRYLGADGQQHRAVYSRVLTVKTLRMYGADVREVQRQLVGIWPAAKRLKIDGYYGPLTAAAVKSYQLGNGLTPNGVVNFTTWDQLFSIGE